MQPRVIFKNGARSIFLASKAEETNEASSPIKEDFSKRAADFLSAAPCFAGVP
jgi:hypothetical protein